MIVGRSTLAPPALLAVAKRLEMAAGRRLGERYAPRPLDIDLLLFGERMTSHPELTLPHPRLRERRFYLEPLAALAPRLAVAPDGRTVGELLAAVGQRDSVARVAWSGAVDLRFEA